MQGGNLTDGIDLADLTDADFRMCQLAGIKFNRRPYFTVEHSIWGLAASSDGRYIGVGSEAIIYVVYTQIYPYSGVFKLKFK